MPKIFQPTAGKVSSPLRSSCHCAAELASCRLRTGFQRTAGFVPPRCGRRSNPLRSETFGCWESHEMASDASRNTTNTGFQAAAVMARAVDRAIPQLGGDLELRCSNRPHGSWISLLASIRIVALSFAVTFRLSWRVRSPALQPPAINNGFGGSPRKTQLPSHND